MIVDLLHGGSAGAVGVDSTRNKKWGDTSAA